MGRPKGAQTHDLEHAIDCQRGDGEMSGRITVAQNALAIHDQQLSDGDGVHESDPRHVDDDAFAVERGTQEAAQAMSIEQIPLGFVEAYDDRLITTSVRVHAIATAVSLPTKRGERNSRA